MTGFAAPRGGAFPPARAALAVLAALALVVAACGAATPSSPTSSPAGGSPAPAAPGSADPAASGSQQAAVVVDTDMSVDDITALAILLQDPALDVRAITVSGTGLVHCAPGLRNLRLLLAAFGRDLPIGCGAETAEGGLPFPDEWRAGADAFFGIDLPPISSSTPGGDAAVVLADAIRASGTPVTLVPLGPWTNVAALATAAPDAFGMLGGIHAMAGTIDAPGNVVLGDVTADDDLEWNVAADPLAFRDGLAAATDQGVPVTLVPLDATDDVPVPPDIAARLEPDHTAAGADIVYELYVRNPARATDGSMLWDQLAALLLTRPDLAAWKDASVAVEDAGRIVRRDDGTQIRYASGADPDATIATMLEALRRGTPRPQPFAPVAEARVAWDGQACVAVEPLPTTAGLWLVRFANESDAPASLGVARVLEPHTGDEAITYLEGVEIQEGMEFPDWIVPLDPSVNLDGGATGAAPLQFEPGRHMFVCLSGPFPDLSFTKAAEVVVGG